MTKIRSNSTRLLTILLTCQTYKEHSRRGLYQIMNTSTLSSNTLGHSTGQRTSESQDSELTSSGSHTCKILNQIKSELQEQKQQKRLLKELHLKRVQSLRKELEYLKATEWKYQPIDRYLDQSYRN